MSWASASACSIRPCDSSSLQTAHVVFDRSAATSLCAFRASRILSVSSCIGLPVRACRRIGFLLLATLRSTVRALVGQDRHLHLGVILHLLLFELHECWALGPKVTCRQHQLAVLARLRFSAAVQVLLPALEHQLLFHGLVVLLASCLLPLQVVGVVLVVFRLVVHLGLVLEFRGQIAVAVRLSTRLLL